MPFGRKQLRREAVYPVIKSFFHTLVKQIRNKQRKSVEKWIIIFGLS